MAWTMYVTLSEEDRMAVYSVDPESGVATLTDEVAVSGRPAPLALDPGRRVLHVGRRRENLVTSFRIDPERGEASEIGTIAVDSDPCFLGTDRSGGWLLSAYYNAGRLAVHRIGPDGAAQAPPTEWLRTATGAHALQTDPSNRFAFGPHIEREDGLNAILQFRFDAATGRLVPNDPPRVDPGGPLGPRHFCFHPRLDLLYASNEQGCSVTAYRLDPRAGTLAPVQTVTTLPAGFEGASKCSQIQITPDGRFLYAPNRGHDSIACFALDAADGALTAVGHARAEAVPRAIGLDPAGRFLYAAGLETGRMTTYRIDRDSGVLQAEELWEVGAGPMWVLITDLGRPAAG